MLVLVVFRLQQILRFFNGDIYGDPALVLRVDHTAIVNAKVGEPLLDVGNGLLRRREHVVDFFSCPVFPIVLRVGMRAVGV